MNLKYFHFSRDALNWVTLMHRHIAQDGCQGWTTSLSENKLCGHILSWTFQDNFHVSVI